MCDEKDRQREREKETCELCDALIVQEYFKRDSSIAAQPTPTTHCALRR